MKVMSMYLFSENEYEIYNNLIVELNNCYSVEQLQKILMQEINLLIPSDSLIFIHYNPDGITAKSSIVKNLDKSLFSQYKNYYQKHDIYKERVHTLTKPPVVNRASDFISYNTWEKNEHRNDFLLPQGIYHISCLEIIINNKISCSLSLHRNFKHNDFSDREINILYILAPIIKNVYETLNSIKYFSHLSEDKLTPREKEILPMLVSSFSNEELAERYDISFNTMKTHIRHILAKLECSSRIDLLHRVNHYRRMRYEKNTINHK